jgi:hypothetical protein
VARSIRIAGRLIWLGILSGALALPLWAQDVTVTVPPDDTSSQSQPAAQADDPTAHPTDSGPSSAQAEPLPPPAADRPADSPPAATAETPAPPVKKKHKTAKKTTPAPAAATASADAAAGPAPASADASKPAKKKTAKASCLNLVEDTCGANSACIWVAAGKDDAGKVTKARCRSLAILKKEQEKAAKTAKSDKPEVLPWQPGGAPATATTASVETKPAKKKTAAKKPKPKPAEAAAAAPDAAPAAAAPAGGDSGAAAPPADTAGASGAD